ncbi:hypothetical protein SDC9_201579 [bioreactor metagenome]|uniref:Uncharacterized protein n=1 Tax=bioreactor metagenome TaxID=1076179 RepID=A0A645ISJ5_9ZZZZ
MTRVEGGIAGRCPNGIAYILAEVGPEIYNHARSHRKN